MTKSLPACGMFSKKTIRCVILSFCAAIYSATSFAQLSYTQDISNGCSPLTVTFTNTSSPPANYFRWTFGDGDTINTVNATHVFSAPGNYNVYHEGWDTTGGGMVYQGTFYGPQVMVNGSSGAFYFSTGNTACPGEQVSFYTYDSYNSLSWDFGDGSPLQNWNWTTHTYNDSGIYNVTLIINTSCDTDTIIQSITITNISIPYFTIQSNQNPVCPNDEVFFSIQNNYQAASYNWDFGDGFNSTLYQPSHVFSDTGNYSSILTATNICGNQNSDTLVVSVQNGIFPSSAVNYGMNPTCPYTAVSFQSMASGISFDWDFGDNATDSVRSTQHFYTDTGNYPVELIIENGCGISDTFNINVTVQYNPGNQPNAQINVEGFWGQDTITICTGETVEFRNSSWNNNNGPLTYQWNFGDATSSSLKNVSHVYAGADTFNVEMIASNTCGGNDTAFMWIIVSNSALPDFNPQVFPPSEMGICPGEMVIFTDGKEKTIEETGYSYDIWFGDGDSSMNITSYAYPDCNCMAVHFYQDTGTFIYTFKVTNICGVSDSVSDTVIISNPLPAFMPFADNSAKPDSMWDNSACPGDTVSFFALSGVSFFWDFGDGQTDTAQFATHVYGAPGTYNASVIVTNACGQTDTAYTTAEVKMTNTPDSWFETDKTLVSPGDSINFSYNSDDGDATVNVNWDFGDGASVSGTNAVHAYSSPGLFQVTMTATNGCGSSSNTQNITVVAPVADFSFAFSNNGCTPEMIQFTNLSLYADSFKWNYGDFSPEEFFEDPSHGYGWASTFFVTLTAYNFLTGDSDIITKPVQIIQTPMPGWAWFWPNPNPVCPNGEVEFNSFMFPSPTSVKWYFGDGDSSSLFIVSHTYADTGNFNVTYIAYNSCGSDTDIQVVDVDSSATITASLFASPNPACPGQQIDFTNWTWPTPVSSLWYFGDGDSATSFNSSHAYADTGTYTATLIVYSSCNSDTATINVTIDTSIVPSVLAMVNPDTACINDVVNFFGSGNNLVSFNWDFDDGFSSLQQNPTHSFASNGTYDVIFIGTNSCGNSDTDTVTVAIINNAPPDASFSSSPFSACPGFSNICPGTNIYFTNGSTNSASNEWDFGDGFTSTDIDPVHAYNDTGNYDVRLIATSSCGGKDTVIQCVRITDDATPSAFFCYNPFCFPAPVCFGTEVSFMNWSSDTANSFWDFGDGYTSTEANPKHIFADTGNYTVTLQVTNSCGNTAYTSNSINVTNTVPPSADFFTSPNPACPGEMVNFNVFSMSTANFFWDFGDGDTITSSEFFMSHAFDTTGNYDVTMVAYNNCGSDTTIYSVNIKPGTLADFSFDTVCFGDTTHYLDGSSPTPNNWAWDFGDGNTSTAQNPSHLFLSPGIYLSSLTATLDGCVGSISKSVNVVEINLTISGTDNSCNGSCDGMANVSSLGGIEPYSFIWSDGQTDSTATGLCAGNYSVTVTDFSGCSDTISVTIDEPTAISYGSVVAGLICFGTTDGSIDLLPGSAFYSYYWSNGAITEDISSLSGATYYVTVTDTNSCTDTASFLIEETTSFSLTMANTDISCFGYNDATADAYVTGTTTPFTYLWSDGSTTSSIDSLSAGPYNVTVTDSNGCVVAGPAININEPTLLTSSVSGNNATCNNICNGDAEVNASGGTLPYTFLWSDTQTDSSATALCAGINYVTVTDGNGCSVVDSADISEPSALVSSVTGNDANCYSVCNGDANASVSGGVSPYTFLWSNGQTDSTATGLCAGTYLITTTDANSCTDVDSVTISEPNILSLSVAGNDVSCNGGNDGSFVSDIIGGTAPYSALVDTNPVSIIVDTLWAQNVIGFSSEFSATDWSANKATGAPDVPIYGDITNAWAGLTQDAQREFIEVGYTPVIANRILIYENYAPDAVDTVYVRQVSTGNWITVYTATAAQDIPAIKIVSCTVPPSIGVIDAVRIAVNSPVVFDWNEIDAVGLERHRIQQNNLVTGNYFITVTDANGCTDVDSITIGEPTALSVSVSGNDVSCNGGNDGDATASSTGGTSPYSYVWSDASTSSLNDSLTVGTYYVTATDANGCTEIDSVTISEPATLTVSVSGNDVSCNGGADGDATASSIGGISPYIYVWSDASTAAMNDSLTGGTYYVTVTDANGCTDVDSITISEPTALSVSISGNNVSCNGGNDGDATATASGGTSPYSYLWSTGAGTQNISSLLAGTYYVTATDANGCTDVDSITIGEPTALSVSVSGNDVSCNGGSDGDATASSVGGTTPYSYVWSDASTAGMNDSLSVGIYYVTSTDANGCTDVDSVTISEPNVLSLSVAGNDVSCNGGSDGNAIAGSVGGTSPYTYVWSDASITGMNDSLTMGTYYVTVTDANGCTDIDSVTISEPNALSPSVAGNDVSCNGGSDGDATASSVGGTSPYTYLWSTGATTTSVSGLPPSVYYVTSTDANGCTDVDSITISEPPTLSVSISGNDVSCNGSNDGDATATATGGTSPYTYLWSTGATTTSVSGLPPSVYYVTSTDANGCTDVDSITIGEPTALSVSISGNDVSCNGSNDGDATATATGGTSPYTYLWSTGATTTSVSGLPPSVYYVTSTDANGCTDVDSITIGEPTALSVSVIGSDVSCNGGNDGDATATANGGITPYGYTWSNGATTSSASGLPSSVYYVTATDANGCTDIDSITIAEPTAIIITTTPTNPACGNSDGQISASASGGAGGFTYLWSDGQASAIATGLSAGAYNVTVTDSTGCSVTSTVNLSNSGAPVLSAATLDVSCNGGNNGSIDLSVSGGTAPLSYLWSNGEISEDLDSLVTGNYSVTVTDAASCIAVINATINEPASLIATVYSTGISCFGACDATVGTMVSGGISPYMYFWNDSSTTQSMTGMCAGNYLVTVTDANGCTITDSGNLGQPSALSSSVTGNDANCNSSCDGDATVSGSGGTSPYAYLWSDGQNSATATGLCAGNYSVTVTDFNGCASMSSVTISEPSLLVVSSTGNDVSCNGGSDGDAASAAGGGTSPYSYLWSNGASTDGLQGLSAGTYSVTATDANGCTAVDSIDISEPVILMASAIATNVSCNGGNDGTASATISGGVSPYNYLWSDGQTSANATGLEAGIYSVIATDSNGCSITSSATVSEPAAIIISTSVVNPACGASDGEISASVSGGTSPYSYLWNDSSTGTTISGLSAGSYSLTVTDSNSCTQVAVVGLSNAGAPSLSSLITNVLCNGGTSGAVDLTVSGGTTPYSFNWDNSEITEDLGNLSAGMYAVSVTDASSCIAVSNETVTEPEAISVAFSVVNASCSGTCNGSISSIVSGGVSPYTYFWSNGSTDSTITGLCGGTMNYLTVTDANGCVFVDSSSVSEPTTLALSVTSVDATCFNACNGSASVNISGGTSPYSYNWSNGDNSANADSLCAGGYLVTVTDVNGCSANDSTTIAEPAIIILSVSATDASCNGVCDGIVSVNAAGGTSPYVYSGDGTNLCAGNYTVIVTDANGCAVTDSAAVSEPSVLTILVSSTGASCNGVCDGAISLAAIGGTSPYSFTGDGTNLCAGNYPVTVIDSNGCTVADSASVSEPAVLNISISSTGTSCNGVCDGAVSLSATGGTSPYSFIGDGTNLCAGDHPVMVTDGNGCTENDSAVVSEPVTLTISASATNLTCSGICNGSGIANVSGGTIPYTYFWSNGDGDANIDSLCTGDYFVTVIDSNGCTVNDSATVSEPAAIILTLISTNTNCGGNNGTATANASGGSGFFTYLWDDTNAQTTSIASGLGAGVYNVTVTDSTGCSTTAAVTVNVGSGLFITISSTGQIVCNGACDGTLAASASGGIAPYSYLWSNMQTGQTDTSLCAGTYTCTVTDSTGCAATASGTINESTAISLSFSTISDSGSATGTATVTASGGTPPYSYLWDNLQTDSTATGLNSGYHSVAVTDANGCTETDSIDVPLFIGVSQISNLKSQISMYPNPVRNEMYLKLSMATSEDVTITLINSLGQKTQLLNEKINSGDKILTFDTEKLSTGVYYLQVTIGEKRIEPLRFVKAK